MQSVFILRLSTACAAWVHAQCSMCSAHSGNWQECWLCKLHHSQCQRLCDAHVHHWKLRSLTYQGGPWHIWSNEWLLTWSIDWWIDWLIATWSQCTQRCLLKALSTSSRVMPPEVQFSPNSFAIDFQLNCNSTSMLLPLHRLSAKASCRLTAFEDKPDCGTGCAGETGNHRQPRPP